VKEDGLTSSRQAAGQLVTEYARSRQTNTPIDGMLWNPWLRSELIRRTSTLCDECQNGPPIRYNRSVSCRSATTPRSGRRWLRFWNTANSR